MRCIVFLIAFFFIFNLFSVVLLPQEEDPVKPQKEEEEKKKKKKSKYIVTNDNLNKIEIPKKPYGFIKIEKKDKKVKKSVSSKQSAVSSEEKEKRKREYWQERKKKLLDEIETVKEKIEKTQLEINRLRLVYPMEDILARRINMKNKLDELTELIKKYQQSLEDFDKKSEAFEDEARKAGVPPGWLRDLQGTPSSKKKKDKKTS